MLASVFRIDTYDQKQLTVAWQTWPKAIVSPDASLAKIINKNV